MYERIGVLYVKYDEILVKNNYKLSYAKPGDVGLDLPVVMNEHLKIRPFREYYINTLERWFDIPPGGTAEIPCGLSVKLPDDAWGNIKPRSSTGWKRNLNVLEGTIDSGYTGPLYVLVKNPNSEPIRIYEFDRLAQLIVLPKYPSLRICTADELPTTERGNSGFGSSGGIRHLAGDNI
ncbi:MAG: hypothetical protein QXU32_02050 [Nitrososphaerales archaeon]